MRYTFSGSHCDMLLKRVEAVNYSNVFAAGHKLRRGWRSFSEAFQNMFTIWKMIGVGRLDEDIIRHHEERLWKNAPSGLDWPRHFYPLTTCVNYLIVHVQFDGKSEFWPELAPWDSDTWSNQRLEGTFGEISHDLVALSNNFPCFSTTIHYHTEPGYR